MPPPSLTVYITNTKWLKHSNEAVHWNVEHYNAMMFFFCVGYVYVTVGAALTHGFERNFDILAGLYVIWDWILGLDRIDLWLFIRINK